ncbi:MAG: glutamine--fructose-6-phosphate transaminase (isomerizing) [Candidatus Thorarchaeota archaeon]|jgi:glucosamine--fructose-6-phosphate aminotransferase (isomerizing)
MCGIVAMHCVDGNAEERSLSALKRLEYRGYDSFGVYSERREIPYRQLGAISEANLDDNIIPHSRSAIAHTRWATHGVVAVRNAHPHVSKSGTFAVVHNGVITNHNILRKALTSYGFTFKSETDTEVIANLFELLWVSGESTPQSVMQAVRKRLDGEYAMCVMSTHWDERILATKQESPLVFAIKEDSAAIASDESALLGFNMCADLVDGDILETWSDDGRAKYLLHRSDASESLDFYPLEQQMESTLLNKSVHSSYMLKEMLEIPKAIRSAQAACAPEVISHLDGKNVVLTGCGSAYYAALFGAYLRNSLDVAACRTLAFPADELEHAYRLQQDDVLVCISQSGETYDTVAPAKYAQARLLDVVSVTNSGRSTLSKLSDHTVFQNAGLERCVLSTKSIVSQCIILQTLFDPESELRGKAFDETWVSTFQSQRMKAQIASAVETLLPVDHIFFIGRGMLLPIAYESALKVKEVTYKHAEGAGGGFFKHGTLSLIDERFVTVAHIPSKEHEAEAHALIEANISEIESRQGIVIRVGHGKSCDICLPDIHPTLNPILHLGVGQLLAYHLAVRLGRNVDRPRSLAKSVTVR